MNFFKIISITFNIVVLTSILFTLFPYTLYSTEFCLALIEDNEIEVEQGDSLLTTWEITNNAFQSIIQEDWPQAIDSSIYHLSNVDIGESDLVYLDYLFNYIGNAAMIEGNYFLSSTALTLAEEIAIHNHRSELGLHIRINSTILDLESRNFQKSYSKGMQLLELCRSDTVSSDQKAMILGNLAQTCFELGKNEESETYYSELFPLIQNLKTTDEFKDYVAYRNYGLLQLNKGDFNKAKEFLGKSLNQILARDEDSFQAAKSYLHVGELFEETAIDDSSRILYTQAITNLTRKVNSEVDFSSLNSSYIGILIDALFTRGGFYMKLATTVPRELNHNLLCALSDFRQAIEIITKLTHYYQSESGRFIIANKSREVFNGGIYCAIQLFDSTNDDAFFDDALEWSIQAKSISLYWASQKEYSYPLVGISDNSQYDMKTLRYDIERDITQYLTNDRNASSDCDHLLEIIKQVLKYHITESQIREEFQDVEQEFSKQLVSKALIPRNFKKETYLGFCDLDSLMVTFIVNRNGRYVRKIKMNSEIKDDIRHLKRLLTTPIFGAYGFETIDEYQEVSNAVYNELIGPINALILDRTILIHPDGILLGLPFEPMVVRKDKMIPSRFRDLDYWINSACFRYVASPYLSTISHRKRANSKVLVLCCNEKIGMNASESEIDALRSKFRNTKFLGLERFNEVNNKELESFKKIHISSHLSVTYDDYTNLHFTCSPEDQSTLLSFNDLLYSNIAGSDVFLNTCESGNGPINAGEGLVSMGLACAIAGSGSVIQHYWQSSDVAASFIAKRYYRSQRLFPSDVSLRKAKLQYVKTTRPFHDHPYYWSGLVYYGNQYQNFNIHWSVFGLIIISIGLILTIKITKRNNR